MNSLMYQNFQANIILWTAESSYIGQSDIS